jgi:hypothetical protein
MKKILYTIAACFIAFNLNSCKKETVVDPPSIIGNWKAEKLKLVFYSFGVQSYDTTINDFTAYAGESFYFNFKEDKTFEAKKVNNNTGSVETNTGNYNLSGTNLTLNYKDLSTEDYESVSFDAKRLIMVYYNPNKTDPDRTVYTSEWSRQ